MEVIRAARALLDAGGYTKIGAELEAWGNEKVVAGEIPDYRQHLPRGEGTNVKEYEAIVRARVLGRMANETLRDLPDQYDFGKLAERLSPDEHKRRYTLWFNKQHPPIKRIITQHLRAASWSLKKGRIITDPVTQVAYEVNTTVGSIREVPESALSEIYEIRAARAAFLKEAFAPPREEDEFAEE